jgi:hypothetical protein
MSAIESPPPASRRARSLPHVADLSPGFRTWSRPTLLNVYCFAMLVSAISLAVAFVTPRWKAPGFPSYIGYGKNVEQAASVLTVLGVSLFVIFARRLTFSFIAFGWLAAVLALTKIYYGGKAMVVLLALVAATAVYFTWYDRLRDQVRMTGPDDIPRWHWWVTWVLLPVVAVWVFLINLHPVLLDLHHQGELITSALDLLDGGVPFRTYHWPHGLSDSGFAALLIELTGNKGLGTIILLGGITCVLGLAAVFLLGLGMLRQPLGALVFAALVALLPGRLIGVASIGFFPILSFFLLSIRFARSTVFAAGVLIGLGYLWRIETGVFALATVVVYLLVKVYYSERYARDDHIWQHLLDPHAAAGFFGNGLALLLGVTCSLVLTRLTLGFPTAEWFRTTLVDLPLYHVDSTGFPLPLYWKGVGFGKVSTKVIAMILMPGMLLLALGLYAITLQKAIERRLPLDTVRVRFYTLVLIYSLFSLKTLMDRSAPGNIMAGTAMLLMLVLLDGLEFLERWFRRPLLVPSILAACLASLAIVSAFRPNLLPSFALPGSDNLAVMRASLRSTRTADEMIAPTSDSVAGDVSRGVKQVKDLLDAHGVGKKQFLVYHSASLLYPMLDCKLPTKYYCLGWAANPVMERELIGELERNRVRAFLHVNGIARSMPYYDVPDSYRIPRVHHFIAEKEAAGRRFETRLGTLIIRDDP